MPLYHKDVFMPRRIKGLVPSGVKQIVYSGHAVRESKEDRYGRLTLPERINLDACEVIEVLEEYGRAAKLVVRHSLDEMRHLCLAIIPTEDKRVWFAKTVWANLVDDNHSTLNASLYVERA
jgi:hypothetical protein